MLEPEMNGYPPNVKTDSLSKDGAEVNNPVVVNEGLNPFAGRANLQNVPTFKSKNYEPGVSGWALFEDGTWEFNPISRCRVYLNADATITAGGARKILFDTIGSVGYDNLSEFDLVTNHRFTATNSGVYQVSATVKVDPSAADKFFELSFQVSGTTLSRKAEYSKNGNTFSIHLTDNLQLTAGQYIEVYIDSDEGSNYTAKGVQRTFLSIHRLS